MFAEALQQFTEALQEFAEVRMIIVAVRSSSYRAIKAFLGVTECQISVVRKNC